MPGINKIRYEGTEYEILDAKNRVNIAAEYSASSTYAVGDIVLKDGQLYECNTAISTAEAWTAAHWTAVTVGDEIATVKDGLTAVEDDVADVKDELGAFGVYSEKLSSNYGWPFVPLYVSSGVTYNIRVLSVSGHGYSSIYVSQGNSLTGDIQNGDVYSFTPSSDEVARLIVRYPSGEPTDLPSVTFAFSDATDQDAVLYNLKRISELSADVDCLNDGLNALNDSIADQINFNKNWFDGKFSNIFYSVTDGSHSASSKFVSADDLIPVSAGDVISFYDLPASYRTGYVLFYTASKVYLSSQTSNRNSFKVTAPTNAAYFRFEFSFDDETPADSVERCTVYINEANTSKENEDALMSLCESAPENYLSNQIIYSTFKAECEYASGDTFTQNVILNDIGLEPGNVYTLFCGKITGSSYSPRVRVYIAYTDGTIDRFDVTTDNPFIKFKVRSGKTISKNTLTLIGVNSSASNGGVCKAYNIFLALGGLDFKRYFNVGDYIPPYFYTNLKTAEETIRNHDKDCAQNGDAFLFLTDTHYTADYMADDIFTSEIYNANHSISLVKHVLDNTGTGFMVMGGDLVNEADGVDSILESCCRFYEKMGCYKYRVRPIIGNHEFYSNLSDQSLPLPTKGELYGAFIKYNEFQYLGKDAYGDYYFDNPIQKIRYIIVSCGRNVETELEQVRWFCEILLDVPVGYHIIVVGHAFLVNDMSTFREGHLDMIAALDAVKSGSVYTFNDASYDYSTLSDVTVVCVITGHTHKDGDLTSAGGTLCICTTCDSFAQQGGGITRTKGTVNEQAFDVYQFDFNNRKIYVTRIGYGSDREFSY